MENDTHRAVDEEAVTEERFTDEELAGILAQRARWSIGFALLGIVLFGASLVLPVLLLGVFFIGANEPISRVLRGIVFGGYLAPLIGALPAVVLGLSASNQANTINRRLGTLGCILGFLCFGATILRFSGSALFYSLVQM